MSEGVKISKPGYSIRATPEHMYVDSDTPLLKVSKQGAGTLFSDGTTVTWGNYQGVQTQGGGLIPYQYTVTIPHGLGYTPMHMVYMDLGNGTHRAYLTNQAAGNFDISCFAYADAKNLVIAILSNRDDHGSPPNHLPPFAGTYGFFFYIFYDNLTPDGVRPSL